MKTYRLNSFMTGILYLLGTVFGITSSAVGGKVISSLVKTEGVIKKPIMYLVAQNPNQLVYGSFFILLMGVSLAAMTVFLYPLFKKDSPELAMGMVLFRGALEGVWYLITALSLILIAMLGKEFTSGGVSPEALVPIGNSLYQFMDIAGPTGTLFFLIGATCLYISFYRTKLIPRWLSVWGLIGVFPYMIYALLHYFGKDNGIGFYLQMILAPQEMIMALWLIIKGFNRSALSDLDKGINSENQAIPSDI